MYKEIKNMHAQLSQISQNVLIKTILKKSVYALNDTRVVVAKTRDRTLLMFASTKVAMMVVVGRNYLGALSICGNQVPCFTTTFWL